MRWEDACCRENTSTTILCKMSLVPAKNWSNPQHFSWSTSRMLAKMGISWSFSPLQQRGKERGLKGTPGDKPCPALHPLLLPAKQRSALGAVTAEDERFLCLANPPALCEDTAAQPQRGTLTRRGGR